MKLEEHMELCPDWAPPDPRGTFLALALAGEAGELSNNYKKQWRDGEETVPREKLVKELADTAAYCLMLAYHMGLDLSVEVHRAMIEFESRPGYAALLSKMRERRIELNYRHR